MTKPNLDQKPGQEFEFTQQTATLWRLLDAVAKPIIVAKLSDGSLLFANQEACDLLGFTLDEVKGYKTSDFFADSKDRAYYIRLLKIYGRVKNAEFKLSTADGSTFPAALSTEATQYDGEAASVTVIENLPEKQRALDSRPDSEERLRQMVEGSLVGIFRTTPEGMLLDSNRTLLEVSGYESIEEINEIGLWNVYADQAARKKMLKMIQTRGKISGFEVNMRHKKGHLVPLSLSARLQLDADGKPLHLDGTLEDISERKRAEAILKVSEERYEAIFNASPVMFWLKDTKNNLLQINQAAADFEGVKIAEIEGRSSYDLYPKEQAEAFYQDDLEVVESGKPKLGIVEKHTVPGTGEVMWVETGKVPIRNQNGEISQILALAVDITDQKKAEQSLQENQTFLNLILDTMPGFLFWKDKDSVYLGCNTAYAQATGLKDSAEIVGKTDYDLAWKKEEADAYVTDDKAVMEANKPKFHIIESHLRADGKESWLDTTKIPLHDNEGSVIGILGKVDDITERIKLEKQVQEAFEHRGYQVQISTEISQEIAEASELSDLFDRVVNLTKERLGYYHTQLLRYSAAQDAVLLNSGYGEVGKQMAAEGHRMPMGSGLIGTAAATGETMMRPDLAEDPDWQPNPLLPETRGEIAVPIKLGDRVMGVLDVQSNQAGALSNDDRLLLEGLCGQVAVAMEQTRLRHEMTVRLDEINRLYQTMSREGWQEFKSSTNLPEGFQYDHAGISPMDDTLLLEELFAKIPLAMPGGEVMGELGVADDPEQPLTEEDKAFLEEVSEQVALALESARLSEQTQAALMSAQESEYQLTEAMRISRMANWELDLHSLEFTFSDQLFTLLETSAEAEGGHTISTDDFLQNFTQPDDITLIQNAIAEMMTIPDPDYRGELEYRALRKDGKTQYASLQYQLEFENNTPVRVFGSYLDITQRKLAEEASVKRAAELATVADIGTAISTLLDEQQLLETVVQLTRERFDLYHCHIFLADENGQTLQVKACGWENDSPHVGTVEDVLIHTDQGQSLVAQAARAQNAIIVNDVQEDPNWLANEELPETRAEMAIPMVAGSQILGVLDVQAVEADRFTNEDISIMTTLASQVSVALQNARTYAQTQQQADQEATINLISQRIQSTTSVESALQVAIRELGRALGAKRTNVQLGLPEQQKNE